MTVSLSEVRSAAVPEVVSTLEEMLEKARAGDLCSVAIVAQARAAATVTTFAMGEGDRAHLVYALEVLKLRLMTDD